MTHDLDPEAAARIAAEVDAAFEDQLAMTGDLVGYASVRGETAGVQEYVAKALEQRGYTVERWTLADVNLDDVEGSSPMTLPGETAQQVVAHAPDAGTTGPSLGLNGHVDVVPAGPRDMWTRPPFEAVREGNWLYGRGAGDMKAGVAANIFALDAIRAAGFAPAGPVQIQSVTEEESTGNGALSVLARGHNPDATLTPEPMGETLVSANVGVVWFRVALRGRPAHVAYATTGANAIEAAAPVIAALRRLEADWNAARGSDPDFSDHPHPINVNVGKIAGGDWPSSVPAWCTLDCRAALFPGQDPETIKREIEAAIAEAAAADPILSSFPPEVSWTGFSTRGFRLPPGTAAEAALSLAADRPVARVPSTAYLDARVFQVHGERPSLVYGPLAEEIHGFDERVDIESIRRVTHTMAQFVARWCGLEPLHRQI